MNYDGFLDRLAARETSNAAAAELLSELNALAAKELRTVPEQDRGDVVQAVAIKIIEIARSPRRPDRFGQGYVCNMINRRYIDDFARKAKRARALEDKLRRNPGAAALKTDAVEQDSVEALRGLLDRLGRLRDVAVASRAERFREPLQQAFEELFELVVGKITMDQALAREAERARAAGKASAPKVLRDRLFKRHQRAREALQGAIEKLLDDGAIDEHEARQLRQDCRWLHRCQRSSSSDVSGQRGESQ